MTLLRHLVAAIVAGAVIWAASVQLSAFRDFQMAEIAVYVVAIAGLSILIGLSGQISLGHGAFMAVGAYTTALLMTHLNWPWWAVFLASPAVAAVGGAVVGLAAARLHGPYLAGATLMLAVALPSLAVQFPGVFGGDQGLSVNVFAPASLGATFPQTRWLAWICALAALITLVILANLARSRVGRNWRAITGRPGGGRAGRAARRPAAGAGVHRERGLRRARRGHARRHHVAGLAGLVHAQPVHRAAGRRGARRPRHADRRAVGRPGDRPGAHLRHRRRHQPRPLRRGRGQHPDRRLRGRAHRRHARVPLRHPGRAPAPRPAVPAHSPHPPRPTRPAPPASEHAEDLDAPYRRPPVSEHQEEGTS